jgi:hypothetical protein
VEAERLPAAFDGEDDRAAGAGFDPDVDFDGDLVDDVDAVLDVARLPADTAPVPVLPAPRFRDAEEAPPEAVFFARLPVFEPPGLDGVVFFPAGGRPEPLDAVFFFEDARVEAARPPVFFAAVLFLPPVGFFFAGIRRNLPGGRRYSRSILLLIW